MNILSDKDINELQDCNKKIWVTTDNIEKIVEDDIQDKLGLDIHKSFNDVEISYIKASKLYSDTSFYIYYSMYLLFNIDKKNDDIATLTYKYIADDTKPVFNDSCINYITGFITSFLKNDKVMDNFYKFMALLTIKENNINTDEFEQKINEYYDSIQRVKYSSIKCFYIDINRDFSLEQYKGLKIPKKNPTELFKNVYCNIEDLDNYIQNDVLNIPIYITRLDTTRKIDDNTEIVESIKTNSKEIKTIEFSPYLLSFSNQLFRNTKGINIVNFEKTQITKIEQSSFKKCTLNKLILPSELNVVESKAFVFSKINTLSLSNTKITSLPTSTFLNAEIDQLILPNGLTDVNVGTFAFLKTNTLDLSNTKITSLPTSVFLNVKIGKLNLPDGLTVVGSGTFKQLKINTLDLSNTKITSLPTSVFLNAEIEKLILPNGLTCVKHGTFKQSKINQLILPNELTDVESVAFAFLKTNTLDLSNTKITNLPTLVFLDAEIEKLILPNELNIVGSGTFKQSKINTLDLSNTKVISLPTSAFSNAEIDRLILPSELTDVKFGAFTSSKTNTLDLSKIKNSIDLTNIFNNKHEINQLILPPWFTYDESYIAKIALITTLKKLDITYTKLTLKDINLIHDRMPNVEIIKNKYITMGMYISF